MVWVWCQGCGEQVPQKLIKRARHDRGFGVCSTCLRAWEAKGSICIVCETPVKGRQTVAFSTELKGLTHVDCGGLPLA